MIDEADIHRKSRSYKEYERREAARVLANDFAWLSDKIQAWDDLHKLTSDDYSVVREEAADALGNAFVHMPDKEKAWDDLRRLTSDTDRFVRRHAADALRNAFVHVPDKEKAWDDLRRLTSDTDRFVIKECLIDKRKNLVMSLDFLAKLENEIYVYIKDSTYKFHDIFIESNEKSNQVWFLKYFSPAYFQMFLDNGNKLYISKTPGLTWGDGVYVTSIKNPYSSMMYGSIGVMGWIEINNKINVFDACDQKGIDLYQRWITYTKGLYNYLTTTVHADWANRLLRNKFRKRFKIDLVLFHPDQYNLKYCNKKQDFWYIISDWRSGKPSYSDKVNDCKPLIVVGEQFERMGPGLIYRDLIGKNLNYRIFQYHYPPLNKGKPDSSLINDLKRIHSQNDTIIIVRP